MGRHEPDSAHGALSLFSSFWNRARPGPGAKIARDPISVLPRKINPPHVFLSSPVLATGGTSKLVPTQQNAWLKSSKDNLGDTLTYRKCRLHGVAHLVEGQRQGDVDGWARRLVALPVSSLRLLTRSFGQEARRKSRRRRS